MSICTAAASAIRSNDAVYLSLLLQLAVAAMVFLTLLAVLTAVAIICRRSPTTVGMCSLIH